MQTIGLILDDILWETQKSHVLLQNLKGRANVLSNQPQPDFKDSNQPSTNLILQPKNDSLPKRL